MSKQNVPIKKVAAALPQDAHERRMMFAGAVSVAFNVLFLCGGAALAARQDVPENQPYIIEWRVQDGATTVKKATTPPPSKKPEIKVAKIKQPHIIRHTPPPTLPKEIRDVPTQKQPETPIKETKLVETTPDTTQPEEIKPELTQPQETQPDVPTKGTPVEEKEKFVAAAQATADPLAGTPGSGNGIVGMGSSSTGNGGPRVRSSEDSNPNSGDGGPAVTVKGAGQGMVNIAPDAGKSRGPIGMPGLAMGPRNKVLVATDQAIIPAENRGGFTIEQGDRVAAGTALRNGQGSSDGVLGNPGGTSRPNVKGNGNGTGDGIPGFGGNETHSTRGPIKGDGGGGTIGPKGPATSGPGGDGGSKLDGDGNGTGPGTGPGKGDGNGGNHPGKGGLLGGTGTGGSGLGDGGNGDGTGTAKEVKGDPTGKGLANTKVGVPEGDPTKGIGKLPENKLTDVKLEDPDKKFIKGVTDKPVVGETKVAQIAHRVDPVLSESLRSEEFKKNVSATFQIQANGSFSVSVAGSGNSEVDALIRKALNQWKFEAAMKDGKRVASTLAVMVRITVQ